MRKLVCLICLTIYINSLFSQNNTLYQTGVTAEQNLNNIGNLTPYSAGGVGFDTRYQGVKGSTRLYDTLLPSFLKVKGVDEYMKINADIDLIDNSVLFLYPKTGKLVSLQSDKVLEIIINKDHKDIKFLTTEGKEFDEKIKDQKFYEVLMDGPNEFIKMPFKEFIKADYKGAYTSDRRYDEFRTKYRYYIMSPDGMFQHIQLNRKAILKIFPDKKELIHNKIDARASRNSEDKIIELLEQF